MIRITTLFWIALLVVAGGTVMHVSYQVRHVEMHLAEIARDTHQQEDAIRILSAEWDTLNDPQHIDALAKRYLALQPTPIQRVVALDAIPFKPSDEQAAQLAAVKTQKNDKIPAVKKPDTLVSAAKPIVALPVAVHSGGLARPDDVGLILARLGQQ
jgi:cell division protein FtsL